MQPPTGRQMGPTAPRRRARRTELFRIGQVAALVGVSPSSLRNWETLGLFKAARTQAKYRLYSRQTIAQLRQIKYLRQVKGVNTAGILQMRKDGSSEAVPDSLNRSPDVSPRLAQLRRENNLTLSQVAQSTKLSTSFLSAIERGQANPSIAALQKLAGLYNTSVLSFFDGEREQRKLVRPKDRRILNSAPGVQMELLALGSTQMEAHLFRIAPRASSGGSYHHKGEEFLYMLQGKLEIWLDEIERYVLEPGDSLYFKSTQSHRWCSLTDRECVLLWVNTPPTF